MPVITVSGPALSLEKKRELVKDLTEAASKIMDIPKEAFVVLVSENPQENVGVGGMLLADKKHDCSGESPSEKPKRGGCRRKKTEA